MNMKSTKMFIHCPKCHKKLIERLPNGLFRFIFGSQRTADGKEWDSPPVYIEIHGSLKMKCIRKTCGHEVILNYFPNTVTQSEPPKNSPTIG